MGFIFEQNADSENRKQAPLKHEEPEIYDDPPPVSRLNTVELAGGALFLFFMTYYCLHWAMNAVIHNRKEETVPDIRGKSAMSALEMLSQAGLALKAEGIEFDDSVPVSAVLRQTPSPGTVVREGKVIRAIFSQGGESVFVPGLIGLPLRNAEMLLRQRQLMLGQSVESYSLRSDKGMVMDQDPKAESSVSKNTMINVVVSAGKPPEGIVLMPDFRQKRIDEAMQWASKSDFRVDVQEDSNSLFPNGTILAQTPSPDEVVSQGKMVNFTISGRKKSAGGDADNVRKIHYEVAQGGSQSQIRIVMIDQSGEREVFNGFRSPGSKIDINVLYGGDAKIRIFANGILVEERELR